MLECLKSRVISFFRFHTRVLCFRHGLGLVSAGVLIGGGVFLLPARVQAQTEVPSAVLDRAWQIGEELKSIQDQITASNAEKRTSEAAAQAPVTELRAQVTLLERELASIRSLYRADRAALAAIDGKQAGPSAATPADVRRAADIRREVEALNQRVRAGNENFQDVRKQYTTQITRLNQAKTQLDLELRRLRSPYLSDKAGLEVIDTRVLNAQGKQSQAQIAAERAAKQQEAAEARAQATQERREAPARKAIADAQSRSQASGFPLRPSNALEQDIVAAATLNREASALRSSNLSRDPVVQARIAEIQQEIGTLETKHARLSADGTPFRTQWRFLSGESPAEAASALIRPLRTLQEERQAAAKKAAAAQRQAEITGSILGGITLLVVLGFFVGFIVLLILFFRWRARSRERARLARLAAARRLDQEAWHKLGANPAERERAIKKLFDAKRGSVGFGTRCEWGPKGNQHYHLTFQLSRGLAAMEPREREFLRTAYLLYNAGLLTETAWDYYRFAFISGNGKASIDSWSYYAPESAGVKDGPSAVKYYQDSFDASVDSAVNAMLGLLQKMEESPVLPAVVKEARSRMIGGSAWLEHEEAADTIFATQGPYSVRLGELDDSGHVLSYGGEGSLITIAPPGSGKTQCFVLPNLLQWPGPAVVLDVKGEIYEATSKWRANHVGPVYKFSPLDPNSSHRYNPLTFIRQEAEYLWEDSRFLADMMIVPSGGSDPFWENMSRDVLTAAIAYVCYRFPPNERPMSKVMDILYGIGWDDMVAALKTNFEVAAMRQMGSSLSEMEKKTRDSVLKTAQSSMSAWQGERVGRATQASDWSPLDLRTGKPTIYICINPNEIDSYLSLLRVFIAQHIRMLTSQLPPRDAAPVLFVLDELPRLKKMPPVDEALNIGRQYGIRLWMFAQSFGQLEEVYPNAEGLLGSCAVRTFMNIPLNDEIAQKLSDQLGYKDGPLDNSRQKLVEPIELAGPAYRDLILVLATNTKPARVRKAFAYKDPELQARMGRL